MANPELTHAPSPLDRRARALAKAASSALAFRGATASRNLSRALGWFSVGLGVAELLAPRRVGGWAGVDTRQGLVRAYGLREIATGVALLTSKDAGAASTWMWGRVAGDALDLSTVAAGRRTAGSSSGQVVGAIVAVAGIALLDLAVARTLQAEAQAAGHATDYSDRSGFPVAPGELRGAALETFEQPREMRASLAERAEPAAVDS